MTREGESEKGWRKGRREGDKEREERKIGGREGGRGEDFVRSQLCTVVCITFLYAITTEYYCLF